MAPAREGPAVRLMRLWLGGTPLLMLAMAIYFGIAAAATGRWALLAVLVVLALVALALFEAQRRLLRRLYGGPERRGGQRS